MFFVIVCHKIAQEGHFHHPRVICRSVFRQSKCKFLNSFEGYLILHFIFYLCHI